MKKISLILPVYNVEKYLGKCLDSCLNQDVPLSEYEIIVVIDGSPDNSISIAKRYREKYENIFLVEKENGGLSDARNVGLLSASGKYVWFIDSDDYIETNVLGGILNDLINDDLECLWLKWKDVNEYGKVLPFFEKVINNEQYSVMSGQMFMSSVLATYLPAWTFVFSRDFLVSNELLFTKGMYYEDADFAYRFLPLLKRIKLHKPICYNYLQRSGSIIRHTNYKKFCDICTNVISAYHGYQQSYKNQHLANFYFSSFSAFFLFALKYCIRSRDKEAINYLNNIIDNNNIGKVRPWGSIAAKFLAYIYNIFGWNFLYRFINVLPK